MTLARRTLVAFAGIVAFAAACGESTADQAANDSPTSVITNDEDTADVAPSPGPAVTVPETTTTTVPFDRAAFEAVIDDIAVATMADIAASPGVAIRVLAPGDDIDLAVAVGEIATSDPLRVASNTKTFVAAAILRLVEEGELSLGSTVEEIEIDPAMAAVLIADGYQLDEITIAQLLTHSSGLYDYAVDPNHELSIATDPLKEWTAVEQVTVAATNGDPLFAPGAGTEYSDTGYLVLGSAIESVTGEALAPAVRSLVDYDAIGLTTTWWEALEEPAAETPGFGVQLLGTIPRETYSPHIDLHGGGGLIADIDDLALFTRALAQGEVFDDPATFSTMTSLTAADTDTLRAGLFAFEWADTECFGHTGYWGTAAFTCPSIDLTFAYTWGQALLGPDTDPLAAAAQITEAYVAAID